MQEQSLSAVNPPAPGETAPGGAFPVIAVSGQTRRSLPLAKTCQSRRRIVAITGLVLVIVLAVGLWFRGKPALPPAGRSAHPTRISNQPAARSKTVTCRVVIKPQRPRPAAAAGFVRGAATLPSPKPKEPAPTPPKSDPPQPPPPERPPAKLPAAQPAQPPRPKPAAPPPSQPSQPAKVMPPPVEQPVAPPQPRPPTPRAVQYVGSQLEVGCQLLGTDGKRDGHLPFITLDYRQTLGWLGYIKAMTRLGGQFYVYDFKAERILAHVDLLKGTLSKAEAAPLKGLSPRVREIQAEPAVADLMTEARRQFPQSDCSLVMLFPLHVDFAIVGGIAQGLEARGVEIKQLARVLGRYESVNGALRLHISNLIQRDGARTNVELLVSI